MRSRLRLLVAIGVLGAAIGAACDVASSSPNKIVVTETVCANANFLRMKVNETQRLVLDNTRYSPEQRTLSIKLNRVPVIIEDAIPPNSVIGDPVSNISLSAQPDQVVELDVRATHVGDYTATCGVIIGGRSIQTEVPFQIVN